MTPRSFSAAIAVGMLIGLMPAATHAAPPQSGTISCTVASVFDMTGKEWGFTFRPFIDPDPRNMTVRARNNASACDNSNVVDGKGPIDGVEFNFSGRLRDASCTTFTSTPNFEKPKIKLKWVGPNPNGHRRTIAVNSLKIASSSYDSGTHAVVLVTEPIIKGAFVGKTVTLHLGLDAAANMENCPASTPYSGNPFGQTNPATVVVQ